MVQGPSSRRQSDKGPKGSAGLLIELRRQFNELHEEAKGLRAINELARSISARLDVNEVLVNAMKAAVTLTHAERGYIVLIEDGAPRVKHAVHIDPETDESGAFAFSKSIILEVVSTGTSVLSMNASEDDRFAGAQSVQLMDLRAVMAAPIRGTDGEVLGAIYLDDPMQAGRFTAPTLRLLESFADQVSVAIQTARLHEHILNEGLREQQMATARNVQMSLVPEVDPVIGDLEIATSYTPAQEVGGDLLQYVAFADGRQAVMVADVAGKGMPAALVMVKVHEAAKLLSGWTHDPLDLMTWVNESIVEDLETGTMVTAMLGVFDPASAAVDVIRSGHTPAGVVRAAGGTFEWCEPRGLALGLRTSKWRALHEIARVELAPGDGILMFTDGVSEAMTVDEEQFDFGRIEAYASAHTLEDPRSFVEGLVKEIEDFIGDAEQSDDITIFYARRRPLPPTR